MTWLLDTNILSELVKPRPDAHVHRGSHLGSDDVRAQAAVDRPHIHGDGRMLTNCASAV